MIRYSLQCDTGHAFEGWFRSSEDYDRQRKRRLVTCPSCGVSKVEKAIMAPNVVTAEKAVEARQVKAKSRRRKIEVEAQTFASGSPANPAPSLVVSPEQREMLGKLRELRDAMLKSSDYVGSRFAEEARRQHEDSAIPLRGIHGEATPDEVKALVEDGIDVLPIPVLPDDQN